MREPHFRPFRRARRGMLGHGSLEAANPMRLILLMFGVLAGLFGIGSCAVAKATLEYVHGDLWLAIGAIFLVGAAVVEQLQLARAFLERAHAVRPLEAPREAPPGM